ncbi:diguanylate cyclase [Niallia circulans]
MEVELTKDLAENVFLEINCMPILFGGQEAVLIVGRDITSRKQAELKIKELAFIDTLTKLPNRNSCMHHLNDRLYNQEVEAMSILFLDLDQFKRINDTKGHGQEISFYKKYLLPFNQLSTKMILLPVSGR